MKSCFRYAISLKVFLSFFFCGKWKGKLKYRTDKKHWIEFSQNKLLCQAAAIQISTCNQINKLYTIVESFLPYFLSCTSTIRKLRLVLCAKKIPHVYDFSQWVVINSKNFWKKKLLCESFWKFWFKDIFLLLKNQYTFYFNKIILQEE